LDWLKRPLHTPEPGESPVAGRVKRREIG